MSKTTAFEIQTLKDGQWQLASTSDTKDQAIQEARRMLDTSRHIDGVKVYQEDYDNDNNRADTKLVFNKERTKNKPPVKKKASKKKEFTRTRTAQKPKPQKKGFAKYLGLTVIAVSVIGLTILGLAFLFEYMS